LDKNFPLYLNIAAFLDYIFKPGSPDAPQREQNRAGKYIPGRSATNNLHQQESTTVGRSND
jgi:hypothetical protein